MAATCGSSPQPLFSGQSWHLEAEAVSSALGQEEEQGRRLSLPPLAPLYPSHPPLHLTHLLSVLGARAHGHRVLLHLCLWLQRPERGEQEGVL